MLGHDELANRFGYHAATPDTAPQHDEMRQLFLEVADTLDHRLPDSRAKACALTALQEASMWSNFAIAEQAPLITGPDAARARK